MLMRPGERVGEKYVVERVLGQGGMAVVVAARHEALDQLVAIKVLLPEHAKSPDVRRRFAREARAAVKIRSEHVARVLDVGALSDDTPYIVMEHLEGEDLAAALERRGPLAPGEAVLYVLQACDALREAHELGIVHRDIKPANLFVARTPGRPPRVKLLDFGVSKAPDQDLAKTEAREILGSPWYMAPEQMQNARSADARSDIWSLGVILAELVSGTVPFRGETMTEVIVKVLHEAPVLGPMPAPLARVVRRCLAKDPGDRFADVEALATALRRLERGGDARASLPAEEEIETVEVGELLPTPCPPEAQVVTDAAVVAPPPAPTQDATLNEADGRDSAIAMASVLDARSVETLRPPPPPSPVRRDRTAWFVAGATAALGIALAMLVGSRGTAPRASSPGSATFTAAESAPALAEAPRSEAFDAPRAERAAEAPRAEVSEPEASPPAPPAAPALKRSEVSVAARAPLPPIPKVASPASPPAPAPSSVSAPASATTLGFQVARRHQAELQACSGSSRATGVVYLTVTRDSDGRVGFASARAPDAALAHCVEASARTWRFPAAPTGGTLEIPIRLGR